MTHQKCQISTHQRNIRSLNKSRPAQEAFRHIICQRNIPKLYKTRIKQVIVQCVSPPDNDRPIVDTVGTDHHVIFPSVLSHAGQDDTVLSARKSPCQHPPVIKIVQGIEVFFSAELSVHQYRKCQIVVPEFIGKSCQEIVHSRSKTYHYLSYQRQPRFIDHISSFFIFYDGESHDLSIFHPFDLLDR